MIRNDRAEFEKLWQGDGYRQGSSAQRLVSLFTQYIPPKSIINDYGSGTGRAAVDLVRLGHQVNMIEFADNALEDKARNMIGQGLTYTIASLEKLPEGFPVADWGICIGVLLFVEPDKLDAINKEMRRTCRNLIVEVHDMDSMWLGRNWTTIKGDAALWAGELGKHWPVVESVKSPEHRQRYITICKT